MSTNSYTFSAPTMPYTLSRRFTWPAKGSDESRSCTKPTSVLDCSSSISANVSSTPSNTPNYHTTHQNRQISTAASDPGPQSSHRWGVLCRKCSRSALKPCPSCKFSQDLQRIPEDLNYSIRRFLEDSPYDEPWIVQRSRSDNTMCSTAADAGDNNLGIQRRGLRSKSLSGLDRIFAGIGDWTRDIDA